MENKDRVCGLKYFDSTKKTYKLHNFNNASAALNEDFIITHQGICGKCSTTQDLFVYLTRNLTRPIRKCGVKYFHSKGQMKHCIKKLGFSDACAQVWYWNTINTKKHCAITCIWALLTN